MRWADTGENMTGEEVAEVLEECGWEECGVDRLDREVREDVRERRMILKMLRHHGVHVDATHFSTQALREVAGLELAYRK